MNQAKGTVTVLAYKEVKETALERKKLRKLFEEEKETSFIFNLKSRFDSQVSTFYGIGSVILNCGRSMAIMFS